MEQFNKSFNGYNVYEVNSFVDETIIKVEQMIDKMKEKDRTIEELTKELEHYKSMDDSLNRAILIAEEAANRFKESSLNESDLIITEAKKNANRIINDALVKAEQIENQSARLRRNIINYKRRLKDILEQQSDLIDDLDKIDYE